MNIRFQIYGYQNVPHVTQVAGVRLLFERIQKLREQGGFADRLVLQSEPSDDSAGDTEGEALSIRVCRESSQNLVFKFGNHFGLSSDHVDGFHQKLITQIRYVIEIQYRILHPSQS